MLSENNDRIDAKILKELQQNARIPIVELAKRVGLSPTPCTTRLRNLEERGIVKGYHARLDPAAMERGLLVFVTVKLRQTDEPTLKAFNAAIKPVSHVLECHMTGGGFDYLLKLRVKDMAEYREILGQVIGTLPMVEGTHSYFVMEEVKETSLLPIRDAN
jgi:Lrp/AsnC family transcriptional regulator, leucine-responsive regulatory protein